MRLRAGRPDLRRYAERFDVPSAGAGGPSITFLGVSTLLIDDGRSAVMTDGFFSRPGLARVLAGRLAPDVTRIERCLTRAGVRRLEAITAVHTHYDHALDTATVAELTGAVMIGGVSAASLARGHALPERQIRVGQPDEPMTYGAYRLTLIPGRHCPPDRYPGEIVEPLRPPARVRAYRCGQAWGVHLRHSPSGRTVLVVGSAGWVDGALTGHHADVVYLGVGQLGLQPARYLRRYWDHTVRQVGARRVVLIHWDDFFRPLDRPPRALPFLGDDLDHTMGVLTGLAERDAVSLHLPKVWHREDPWCGLPADGPD
ncbi:MAG: MBL fold metallo-hydrolase [Actinomycetales bacterium]